MCDQRIESLAGAAEFGSAISVDHRQRPQLTIQTESVIPDEKRMAWLGRTVTQFKISYAEQDSVLLNHYPSRFNDREHSVALLEFQFFSTAPGDSTLDQIVADAHQARLEFWVLSGFHRLTFHWGITRNFWC